MKVATILLTPILTAIVGYRIGLWWLHRTVAAPELESAVYPMLGALVGGVIGVILAAVIAVAMWTRPEDRQ